MDDLLAEPTRQLGELLADITMNMPPWQRHLFYYAIHDASGLWLDENGGAEYHVVVDA